MVMTVTETIEEGEAEAINLSASFTPSESTSYNYNINDLKDVVKKRPPTYVKITSVPAHGKIIVK